MQWCVSASITFLLHGHYAPPSYSQLTGTKWDGAFMDISHLDGGTRQGTPALLEVDCLMLFTMTIDVEEWGMGVRVIAQMSALLFRV